MLLPMQLLAQSDLLLEPLSESEADDAIARNDYFIRKYTFAAKRYRLVKVNVAALESRESIVIPLFDDEQIVVSFKDMRINEFSGGYVWRGSLVQDDVTVEAILDHVPNVDAAQKILESMTDVSISVDLLERDVKSGANLNPVYSIAEALSKEKPNRFAERHSNPNYVQGISADLATITNRSPYPEYLIRMLGMGGPYHVLVEVDPSRILVSSDDAIAVDDQGPVKEESAVQELDEEERRRQILRGEIRAFRDSLGPNPHDALYQEKMAEKEVAK